MAGTAPPTQPYLPSPALAHAAVARRAERHIPASQVLVFGAALVALFASAAALVAPQVAPLLRHIAATTVNSPAPTQGEIAAVVSYASEMRADDTLVQVRPGVFAKRSNVEGVQVGGRTVFYDIFPHQSFGPLRSGRVAESQINVLGRENTGGALVLVYVLK